MDTSSWIETEMDVDGATLSHVVIGSNQSAGIHCLGSCTIEDVWFEVRSLRIAESNQTDTS